MRQYYFILFSSNHRPALCQACGSQDHCSLLSVRDENTSQKSFPAVISESGSDQCLWAVSHHAASMQCRAIECHNVTVFSSLTPTPLSGLY